MPKYVKIRTKVDAGYDDKRLSVEKIGEDTYRMTICRPEEFDFRNRSKAERFDQDFVSKYNQVSENEDQFELAGRDAYRELTEFRKRLAGGESEIRLKVKQ